MYPTSTGDILPPVRKNKLTRFFDILELPKEKLAYMLIFQIKVLYLQCKTNPTMKEAHLKIVDRTPAATMYTIVFAGEDLSEFEKFIERFKDSAQYRRDYQIIVYAIKKMSENGILERYFRYEGKRDSGVCAIPVTTSKLRLYCLRLSDRILILGNGGVKNTRTYQEDADLNGYVIDLKEFEKIIKVGIKKGAITVSETTISGIEIEED